uniref:Activator of basal transcription 1 n=1 Tax=Oryzias sinensis TaxID=183150 RepID=A0A8C7WQX3_9TELE
MDADEASVSSAEPETETQSEMMMEEDRMSSDLVEDDASRDQASEEKAAVKKTPTSCQDRKCVPGIVYLGHIPPRLRPKHLRNMLSVYGEIGRIFLQPEDHLVRRKKKKSGLRRCDFTEGWVEFRDKRVAKRVAASLHNTPMGTRKRQRFSSDLWCIKYLHRFQWTHLSERLAYEQTVLQQRLRTEVSQAKRETNFYLNNVEKSTRMDDRGRKGRSQAEQVDTKLWEFTQRQTEEEIQNNKKKKHNDYVNQKNREKVQLIQQKSQSNVSLLCKIFNFKRDLRSV